MKLSHLLASQTGVNIEQGVDREITSITDDSRAVTPGSLFIARAGTNADGAKYVADAIARGAVAVLAARGSTGLPLGEATLLVADDLGAVTPSIVHAFHGYPARAMRVVGVTGTNGKTTIAFLVQHLLKVASCRCGLLGTVITDDGLDRLPASLTTPGTCELAAVLGRMVRNDCLAVAMEVSSHALHQHRTEGVDFSVAIFTNLTGDHLDYHGTMAKYADAKALLFAGLAPEATAVVNADDPAHIRMIRDTKARVLRCSMSNPKADCVACVRRTSVTSMDLELKGPWGAIDITLPFVGAHNAMNALEAAATGWALGVDREGLRAGLTHAPAPPGRLEPVSTADSPFAVLVDYAHTDDALSNVLSALRKVVGSGRVITVFGCGGDRDRTKRPRMMAVAASQSDHVIVTSDNPRTEDPLAIVAEILAGAPRGCAAQVESQVDRALAIARAVSLAHRGDIVLIAGKGHEDYQIVGKERRSFDDRVEARKALDERAAHETQTRISLGASAARNDRTSSTERTGVCQ